MVSSQYTKYVKEWENTPPQETLPIDALYFPNDGITVCAADLCYNSRTIIIGDSNQLHLIRRDRMNWGEWFLFRLGSQNELYIIKVELNVAAGSVASAALNRKFIGMELNKEYYDIAVKRIKEVRTNGEINKET